jgi:hypothetical protein
LQTASSTGVPRIPEALRTCGGRWYAGDVDPNPVDPKRTLKGLLLRVFRDGKADTRELGEIVAFVSTGALALSEMEDAFEEFVTTTWNITMADGVVSEEERTQLREITRVLGLDPSTLPEGWRRLLG